MLDLKALLTKVLKNMTPETITPSITNITIGSIVEIGAVRCGKIVQMVIGVKKSTATAAGSNVFAGTLQSQYCPAALVNGVGYSGSSTGILQIVPSTGAFTIRITGAQLNANTNIYVSTTYILP